ncbi:50S ribosomal protein L11 methyltransferase, partial [Ligilactobacillus saerimneri]
LLPLIPQVHKNLRPTGKLILSGIIMEKENEIVTALNAAGFQVEEKITDGKWLALVAHNTLNS